MNCSSHCIFQSGADEGLGCVPLIVCPQSSVVFPVIIRTTVVKRGGSLLTGTMYGATVCFFRGAAVVLAWTF